MTEVFISYASATVDRAKQIADALRGLGYGVWRDDELPAHRAYGSTGRRTSAAVTLTCPATGLRP
jgi:hypothetical protein